MRAGDYEEKGCGRGGDDEENGRDQGRPDSTEEQSFQADDAVESAFVGLQGQDIEKAAAVDHAEFGREGVGGSGGKAGGQHEGENLPAGGEDEGQQASDGCDAAVGDDLAGPPGGLMGGGTQGGSGGPQDEEKGQERQSTKAVAHIDDVSADCPGDGGCRGQLFPARAGCGAGGQEKKDEEIQVMHACG